MNFEQARFNMIEQQVRTWDVLDAQVLNLMRELPREDFVPPAYQSLAYADAQIPLAHDQVMLPPREIGRILQALQVQPEEQVLEVGTGSGYLTTLLAKCAQQVISVELFADISTAAANHCQKHITTHNVTFQIGNATTGWEPSTSFDIICITGALPYLPNFWRQQLKIGGRLFVVLGKKPVMQATLITRVSAQEWESQMIYETLLPTLVHAELAPQFEF